MFIERRTHSRVFGLLIPGIQPSQPTCMGYRSCIDISANTWLIYVLEKPLKIMSFNLNVPDSSVLFNVSAEANVVQLLVRITIAIVMIQHPIYFQDIAIGRGTWGAINTILPSRMVMNIT